MSAAGIPIVAVTFWLFIAIVCVGGMILDYRRRQLALEPLRLAIERGQQLSPEVIAQLLGQDGRAEPLDPRLLQVGGIITCACGVGIALLAGFVALVFPPYHWIVLGAGVVSCCVGVGLMLAARALHRAPPDAAA